MIAFYLEFMAYEQQTLEGSSYYASKQRFLSSSNYFFPITNDKNLSAYFYFSPLFLLEDLLMGLDKKGIFI